MPYKSNDDENAAARRRYAAEPQKTLDRCAQYREANIDQVRERDRARDKDPARLEQKRASSKRWQEANPDKAREACRRWAEANREEIREAERRRRIADPEKFREKNRKWARGNTLHLAKKRDYRLKKQFGLSAAEYEVRLAAQGGVCMICKNKPGRLRLAVDHSHATGKVRGLLCGCCNTAIGKLRESPELLRAAIEYLEHNS